MRMNLVEMLKRSWHLSQHDVCAAAVHLADVVAFKRVHEALGHAVRLRTAHRGVDGFDAQLLDQGMRILRPKSAAIIAQEFQLDAAAHLGLAKTCFDTLDQHVTYRFTRQATARPGTPRNDLAVAAIFKK